MNNVVHLAPPIVITQQDPLAAENAKRLRQAFREGRGASLYSPEQKCPYQEASLAAEWQRGYDDGAGEPEKIASAREAGRRAGLLMPQTPCPYEEFMPSHDKFRLAWMAGFEEGTAQAAKIDREELAWSRGWYAGCYAPGSPSPYDAKDPLYAIWCNGTCRGITAAQMLLSEFDRVDGVSRVAARRARAGGGVKVA